MDSILSKSLSVLDKSIEENLSVKTIKKNTLNKINE